MSRTRPDEDDLREMVTYTCNENGMDHKDIEFLHNDS